MTVRLSAAVMAHPKRRHFVEELVPRLDVEPEVVWDQHNDRWETGRRSLLAYDRSATHHLVVQDDALVARDLAAGTARAVVDIGDRPVCLYIGIGRPYRHQVQQAYLAARANDAAWMEMPGPWWGVALVIPTAHIPELVRWCDTRPDVPNYDKRISRWYQQQGIPCWYSMPSLVDHRRVGENPSLVPGRTGDRYAHWFIGEEASALDVQFGADKVVKVSSKVLPMAQRRALNARIRREEQEQRRELREQQRRERSARVKARGDTDRKGRAARKKDSSPVSDGRPARRQRPERAERPGWRTRAEQQAGG